MPNKTPAAILARNEAYRLANWDKVYAKQLEWQRANKEKCNDANRRSRRKLRLEVLAAYGNCCKCCGELEEVFLDIDHILGGGNRHRRELKGNAKFYPWLKANNFPPEFQCLCKNCNGARAKLGFCPHELKRVTDAE